MIYPNFLKDNDVVGITAISCGVLKKIDKYEQTLKHFKNNNLNIIETNNVRTSGIVSSDSITRWNELKELYLNNNVKMINIASGGDFAIEILKHIDFDIIKNNIKWIGGSSDPTSLLFTITTNLDIATIYTPCNMSGFSMTNLHSSLNNYFDIIKGNVIKQNKFNLYEEKDKDIDGYNLDTKNEWININGNINKSGIIIGGCIECLKDIIGTKFDNVNNFIEKYKNEGIIWYFDIFSMSANELYNTLLQFEYAGWFKYTKAILFSKVKFPSTFQSISYIDAIKRFSKTIPMIYKFDVGHVKPSFTIINGSLANLISNDKESSIELKIN